MEKQIKNLPYTINEQGQIYSIKSKMPLKLTKKSNGYMQAKLFVSYDTATKKRTYKYPYVHRLVAEYFIENPKNLPCVNHINGDKENNSVHNLEWCSYQENMQHAVRTGLFKKDTKITNLEEIFQDYCSKKYLLSELEQKYNWFSGSRIRNYLQDYATKTNRLGQFIDAWKYQRKLIGSKSRQRASKKVAQYSLDNTLIKVWDSSIDAARELGLNQGNISNAATGRSKTTGGFKWAYV